MLGDGVHPLWETTPHGALADVGDLALPNTSLEGMREALAPLARDLVDRHHVVWLGGDHSITLPVLRAYRSHFGRPLGLLHFDAHCDTWEDHYGEPSGHGTWLYEAVNEGVVDPAAHGPDRDSLARCPRNARVHLRSRRDDQDRSRAARPD